MQVHRLEDYRIRNRQGRSMSLKAGFSARSVRRISGDMCVHCR